MGKTTSGSPCKFPFVYDHKVYESCTTDDSDNGQPWCSTGVSEGGFHIRGQYGDCSEDCPRTDNTGGPAACQTVQRPYENVAKDFPVECMEQLNKTSKNIFFFGNSYTYFNDLPAMVKK